MGYRNPETTTVDTDIYLERFSVLINRVRPYASAIDDGRPHISHGHGGPDYRTKSLTIDRGTQSKTTLSFFIYDPLDMRYSPSLTLDRVDISEAGETVHERCYLSLKSVCPGLYFSEEVAQKLDCLEDGFKVYKKAHRRQRSRQFGNQVLHIFHKSYG